MTEYLIIFFLLIISILSNNKLFLIPTLLYMLFIGCFRGESVGTDINTYYNNFVYSRFDPKSWNGGTFFEPGFTYILLFIKYYISKNYMDYISILFFYSFSITIWFFYKYSKHAAIAFFIFYTLGGYFFYMNGMRQAFAFSTSLLALNYFIKTQKTYTYLGFILLITILLHNSCFVLAIIPYISQIANKINLTKKHIYIAIIISLIFATILRNTLLNILGFLVPFLGRFGGYITRAEEQGILMTTFLTATCLITVHFTRNTRNIFFLTYVLGTICYNMLASFSNTAPRIAWHLIFLSGISYSITYFQLKGFKQKIYLVAILCIGTINFTYTYLIKGTEGVVPYEFRELHL